MGLDVRSAWPSVAGCAECGLVGLDVRSAWPSVAGCAECGLVGLDVRKAGEAGGVVCPRPTAEPPAVPLEAYSASTDDWLSGVRVQRAPMHAQFVGRGVKNCNSHSNLDYAQAK